MTCAGLPFLAGLIAVYVISSWRWGPDQRTLDRRDALFAGWTLVALWTVLGTELLSVFHAFHAVAVALWWVVLIVGLFVVAVTFRYRRGPVDRSLPLSGWFEWGLALAFLLILVVTLATALVAPPSTNDCLSYHLPRQVHWIHRASVAHYPTHEYRQLVMPPLAEFMGAHLMLLSGGDRLANLPQWFGLLITSAVVSRIARALGADRTRQWLAALLVATLPTAYLWASNAKNGLVLSTWFCAFIGLAVLLLRDPNRSWPIYIVTGTTLGLLAFTKGTGILCAIPVVLVIGARLLLALRVRALAIGAVIGILAVIINAGHFSRNMQTFGSPTWSGEDLKVGDFYLGSMHMDSHAPRDLAANLLMNVAIHYGSTDPDTNAKWNHRLAAMARAFGADLNNPRIRRSHGDLPFRLLHPWKTEDTTGSPVHMTLMLGFLALALAFPPTDHRATFRIYALLIILAFLMFPLTLRMTDYRARLHLPILCAAMPMIAAMLQHRPWRWLTPFILAWAAWVLWPVALYNDHRPLVTRAQSRSVFLTDREELRFRTLPWLREPTRAMVDRVEDLQPRVVGLRGRHYDREYLLLQMLRARLGASVHLATMDPPEWGAAIPPDPAPDCVVADQACPSLLVHEPSGRPYIPTATHWRLVLFEPVQANENRWDLASKIPFLGWDSATNLGWAEGPFPQWDLPLVHAGLAPATHLSFTAEGRPLRIGVGAMGMADPLRIEILLDGISIGEIDFDAVGARRQFDVVVTDITRGAHLLVLEYSAHFAEPEGLKRHLGAVLMRLQILHCGPATQVTERVP